MEQAALHLKWIQTDDTNPYHNLALEEYLLNNVRDGECLLYLWQNRHTVVIGKNQDAYAECDAALLEAEGGRLARRASGGGAVYHDMGNLNFTFIAADKHYDVQKQLDVIVGAVASFGVAAEKTGRNDICAAGKKFSGNAFLRRGNAGCHHGTLLIDTDMEKLSRYLRVSEEKLASKGVRSVKSRVVNLRELCGADVASMKRAMVRAFSEVYGGPAAALQESALERGAIARLREKYESDEWRFGSRPRADAVFEKRFDWGGAALHFRVEDDRVSGVRIFSDAMDAAFIPAMERALAGARFDRRALAERLDALGDEYAGMVCDVKTLIAEQWKERV